MEEVISTTNIKFYTIGEVAKMLGEAPSTLRYWEKEFEQIKPLTTDFGRRVYTQAQIDVIAKIKTLLHEEGMTIKGAKNFLSKPSPSSVSTSKPSNADSTTPNLTNLQEIKGKLNDLLSIVRKEKKES